MATAWPDAVLELPPYSAYSLGPLMNCAIPYAPELGFVAVRLYPASAISTLLRQVHWAPVQPNLAAVACSIASLLPLSATAPTLLIGPPVDPVLVVASSNVAAPAVIALTLAALCGVLPEMMLRNTVDHDLPSMADHRNIAPPPAMTNGIALLAITSPA